MPLYEYLCEECGRRCEVIQKFSDEPLTECTECGGRLERLLSAPAIQFKGSGWYVTDYARKGNGDGASQEGSKDARPDGKAKSGSDEPKPAKEVKSSKEDSGSAGAKTA